MNTLVLTVIGDDRTGIVNSLAEVVAHHDGNWERSQMAELAGAFAGIVVVTLPEARAADFTAALEALPDLTIAVHDADASDAEEPDSRITVELLGNDRPGLVRELTSVFAEQGLSIEEIETGSYDAPMAGGRLFEALLMVPVTKGTDTEALRGALEKLAMELMVDITVGDLGDD
ncbi:MAG TPA: ACT domain-containing protein [Propionibacterium sp.]|nr:ACT domain-containing protein [Propionibacterium sp.]